MEERDNRKKVNTEIDRDLWQQAKQEALRREIELRDWLREAISNNIRPSKLIPPQSKLEQRQ